MYDHIDGLTDDEKHENIAQIKAALEGLNGVIPGLNTLCVYSQLLDSSNADIVLYSIFENAAALKAYKDHPEHIKVAVNVVRPRVKNRRCADFDF
ncbi:MAG: Dabb family protein [Defluviitaleaceae bacterium]|nr:Dabb family protein [Defluviitaleaceae bacterium]